MPTMNQERAVPDVDHEICRSEYWTIAENSLLSRIRDDFREMPGMRLTLDQVMRMWMLDYPACLRMLGALVETRFLEVDASGKYRKVHCGQ